jgi:hypothetical protein
VAGRGSRGSSRGPWFPVLRGQLRSRVRGGGGRVILGQVGDVEGVGQGDLPTGAAPRGRSGSRGRRRRSRASAPSRRAGAPASRSRSSRSWRSSRRRNRARRCSLPCRRRPVGRVVRLVEGEADLADPKLHVALHGLEGPGHVAGLRSRRSGRGSSVEDHVGRRGRDAGRPAEARHAAEPVVERHRGPGERAHHEDDARGLGGGAVLRPCSRIGRPPRSARLGR